MSGGECTEQGFLRDVADHELTVIRADGINRHIRFRKPGTGVYSFDLITWPGHLCIAGDCGTYVFSRIEDMFRFFRNPEDGEHLYINPSYWGEKLLSVSRFGGYKEFSKEGLRERVREHYENYLEYKEVASIPDLWERIEDDVLSRVDDGEHYAYHAVHDFEWSDPEIGSFSFVDFFDGGGTEQHAFNYLWCLYAIVWGIQQFDAQREAVAA